MKNLSSWLITIFIIMFWILRVIVAITFSMGTDFMIKPLNSTVEIVLLFLVLACIPLIFKRKVIGPIICLIAYGAYLGPTLVTNIMSIINGETVELYTYVDVMASAIGIILPLIAIFDILMQKMREKNPVDKKTDWFYKNEEYDRKLDERADKNNYRTM